MTFPNRLRELREARGLSLEDVAAELHTTHQHIGRLEKGERRLTDTWIKRFSSCYGVELVEIMIDPTDDPEVALRLVGAAARRVKGPKAATAIDELINRYDQWRIARKKTGRRGDDWNYPDIAVVPEIDVRAGLGGGGEASSHAVTDDHGNITLADDVTAVWGLPENYVRSQIGVEPKSMRILEATGDSMFPTIHDSDRVAINVADRNPTPPGIFAIWDGFGVVIKRVERIMRSDPPTLRIISDNEMHRPVELTADEVTIIGRVKWYARAI